MRNIRKRHDERGAIAVWASVGILAFIIAIGIGVDFSGHARTSQHARGVAHEAARAGAQEVLLVVDDASLDPAAAKKTAEAYIHTAGFAGAARVIGSTTVQTEVTGAYDCRFLSMIGIWELPVRVEAEADLIPAFEGRPG